MKPMASAVAVFSEFTAPTNAVRRVMARHPELLLILLGLTLTFISRYGSSLKTKPITQPPKQPKSFFAHNSPVYDFYNGDLDQVVYLLGREEFIFLMYYAPWCSKSMAARSDFHQAAKHMQGQVKFVAVNCWWPEGQCRKRYKFLMFPVLFAYHTHLDGFRYLGQMSADHMVKFVDDLIYPITALHSHSQVKDFVVKHDSAVVGYFDFTASLQSPDYLQFYFASMRILEQDPYNQIKFCTIDSRVLASSYNLTHTNEVVLLRLSNSTVKFPDTYNFTSSQLVTWSLQHRQKPFVRFMAPLGVKSLILSKELSQGPAIIAFYANNPLFNTNRPYHVLKDLALQYHSCKEIHDLEDDIVRWKNQVISAQVEYHQVVEFCANYRKQRNVGLYDFKCCISLATKTLEEFRWLPHQAQNVCEYCVHRQNQDYLACPTIDLNYDHLHKWAEIRTNFCKNAVDNYNLNEYHSLCCKQCDSSHVPMSPTDHLPMSFRSDKRRLTDRYVWQQLENKPRMLCRKLTLQKLQGHVPYNEDYGFDGQRIKKFTGLGCRSNRTMGFYAMDGVRHAVFAERLGVDVSSLPENPAVVIVDIENEEQYLLKETFTSQNIASFILNFTLGQARRTLRSRMQDTAVCDKDGVRVCITEVTSLTFQSVVINSHKDVLLLVYSTWCGFCANINHVYLSLAKYFHTADSIVFARINGDTNDLPWEFTVDSYPVFIFFPANRKSDSLVFPDSESVNVPNLVRFILQHSTQNLRVETALGVCSKLCIQRNWQYATNSKYSLQQKQVRLLLRLTQLSTKKDISEVALKYNKISIQHCKSRLKGIRRKIKMVDGLLQFLANSNGVQFEHSKMHQFLSKHKLLQDIDSDSRS